VRALVRPGQGAAAVELAFAPDLADAPTVRSALQGVDAVVHLAARVHVTRDHAVNPAAAYHAANVLATRVLLEQALAAGVQRVVFASSVKAVGESNLEPWTAGVIPRPADPYGASKLEAEQVILAAGVDAVILRLPVVYGPGQRANMLRLFQLVERGVPLPLGGIDNRRSLAFVGNVAAAIDIALSTPRAHTGTYFVSDGEDLATPELVRRIAGALGRSVRLVPAPRRLLRVCARIGDALDRVAPVPLTTAALDRLCSSLVVDSRPLWRLRGGSPPFTVDAGLAATAAWFQGGASAPVYAGY
jgi:nucleoside-diphosphate-sugar epimerase